MGKLIEIVFDPIKKKLRAKPKNGSGWVRFPKELREEGAVYEVHMLRPSKGGSYIAIKPFNTIRFRAVD